MTLIGTLAGRKVQILKSSHMVKWPNFWKSDQFFFPFSSHIKWSIRKSLLLSFALASVPLTAFFPFFWAHTLVFSFYRSAFRLAARKWISARLQLLSVLQHHANHGRGKMMVEEKIWFRPNLATCCDCSQVSYCAPRADLASSFFPLHLHESLQCMCVFMYIWACPCVTILTQMSVCQSHHSVHLVCMYTVAIYCIYSRGHNSILSFFLPT